MNLSKLKQIHVIIIGSFLCVAAAAGMFFLMVSPQMKARDEQKTKYETESQLGNEASKAQAIVDRDKAKVTVAQETGRFYTEMRRKMPMLVFDPRDRGMIQWWRESASLGSLLKSYAHDPRLGSVQEAIQMPQPPVNPNDPFFANPLITVNMGEITATGDFKTLMDHITRWNACNRLVRIDSPQLTVVDGSILQLKYTATCYVYPMKLGGDPIKMAGDAPTSGQTTVTPGGAPPQPQQPAPSAGEGGGGEGGRMPRG